MKVVIKEVNKDELQRKLGLKNFFDSVGYKEFSAELAEMYEYSSHEVNNMTSNPVDQKNLSKLNFQLGEKAGLVKVLNLLRNLKEELEDNSPSEA